MDSTVDTVDTVETVDWFDSTVGPLTGGANSGSLSLCAPPNLTRCHFCLLAGHRLEIRSFVCVARLCYMLYEAEHIYLQWCCLLKSGNLRKHFLVLKSETQLTKQINRIGLKTNSRHIGEKIVENEKLVKNSSLKTVLMSPTVKGVTFMTKCSARDEGDVAIDTIESRTLKTLSQL